MGLKEPQYYECDCGRRYSYSDGPNLCAGRNHGNPWPKPPEKKLYEVGIEIPAYDDRKKKFNQYIYVTSEKCPTCQQIKEVVLTLHKRDSQYKEYYGDWADALNILANLEEWPNIEGSLIQKGVHTKDGFGVAIRLITPIELLPDN